MHAKSLSLDVSPELIPYDCFIHPNLICLPKMTSEKTRAEDSHATYRTAGTMPTPSCLASFPGSSEMSFSTGGNGGSRQSATYI